jgi:hypothetical protein
VRSNLESRLKALERHGWTQPQEMQGSIEMHCLGGLSHFEGQTCEEHEQCVFRSTPIRGRIRRQYLTRWQAEMKNPFDLG